MKYERVLAKEAKSFDKQIINRIKLGFVPDLDTKKVVRGFYNNIWRDSELVKIHWGKIISKITEICLKNKKKVLEIGCGSGFLSLHLARKKLDVLGIDVSSRTIHYANKFKLKNKKKIRLEYLCQDALKIKKLKKKFDTIIFFRYLHHFKNYKKLLIICYSLLNKSGKLVIYEPFRKNFDFNSATYVFVVRNLLKNWSGKKNIYKLNNFEKELQDIIKEYKYEKSKKKNIQSILDNSVDDINKVKFALKKFKKVKTIGIDAISDKVIGGIRGRDSLKIAKFIKEFDHFLVLKKIINPTNFFITASKN